MKLIHIGSVLILGFSTAHSYAVAAESPVASYETEINHGFFCSLKRPYILRVDLYPNLPAEAPVQLDNTSYDDRPATPYSFARFKIGQVSMRITGVDQSQIETKFIDWSSSMGSDSPYLSVEDQANSSLFASFNVGSYTGTSNQRLQILVAIQSGIKSHIEGQKLVVNSINSLPETLTTSWQQGILDPGNGALADSATSGFALLHKVYFEFASVNLH